MQGVFARFKEQNAQLRKHLLDLEPSGVVNAAVFKALDRFDEELSGHPQDTRLQAVVAGVFSDFSVMRERNVREQIAGNKTGQFGTKGVDYFGYVNYLKDCDAGVQWALFMPDVVKHQQNGFQVDRLIYVTMPAMRFVGKECVEQDAVDMSRKRAVMATLDAMSAYQSGFDHDLLFQHHFGKAVDQERWHGYWGRFMAPGAPVPEGYTHFDFVPEDADTPYLTFRSEFAFAVFSGDAAAMHKREGYDSDAMYDVTRNIMLGQGVPIPYPERYWTAEVFLNGYEKDSTAYLFSAVLSV